MISRMRWVKLVLLAISLIVVIVVGFIYMSGLKKSDSLGEQDNQAIKNAAQALQQRNFRVENYESSVVKSGESIIVVFSPPGREAGLRGSASGQPSFEVELTADLQTTRVSVAR